jgi:RNA polymerase sigma-70 factor (ECF subfamily)
MQPEIDKKVLFGLVHNDQLETRQIASARLTQKELETLFELLLNNYGQCLSRIASSYEASPQGRQDLLQEIHLAIWTALRRFRGDCSWRTFVYRIAHNRCLTHIWRRKRLPNQLDETVSEVPADQVDIESATVRKVDHERLIEAIRELPLLYRQVMILVMEDLPRDEIGAVLGISENNVAVRVNRGTKMLRERLR